MQLNPEMIARFNEVLDSGVLTNGKYVRMLENRFREKFAPNENCVAVSSCTSGLILALKALMNCPQLSDFTFSATAHSAHYGCRSFQLGDVDPRTFNMLSRICSKSDGLLATHVFGNPCDCDRLTELADTRSLPIVFDAAHSLGAKYKGKHLAKYGDASVFSLSPTKQVTSGEGGMVVARRRNLAERLLILRNYGNEKDYNCSVPGLNARMSEFSAVLGLESIKGFNRRFKNRMKIVHEYMIHFDEKEVQMVSQDGISAWKDFSILLSPRNVKKVRDALGNRGVETKRYFRPISSLDCYSRLFESQPNAFRIWQRIMQLPLHDNMNEEDARGIAVMVTRIIRS
jgi:dTDP-4-amino-4,6-dideoxygalactose transaminase